MYDACIQMQYCIEVKYEHLDAEEEQRPERKEANTLHWMYNVIGA